MRGWSVYPDSASFGERCLLVKPGRKQAGPLACGLDEKQQLNGGKPEPTAVWRDNLSEIKQTGTASDLSVFSWILCEADVDVYPRLVEIYRVLYYPVECQMQTLVGNKWE